MRPEDAKFADEYGGIAEQYAESANLSKRKCDTVHLRGQITF